MNQVLKDLEEKNRGIFQMVRQGRCKAVVLDGMRITKSMLETVTNENKVGRNDPCSCGSNLKFKKCCGR